MVHHILCILSYYLFSHFSRTSQPSIHWIVPILAGVPFGTGTAQILQSLVAYLLDAYATYAASAIAATVILRSLFAMAFPLFSPSLFSAVGDQWACTLFAFLALICTPMPILFWVSTENKYGRGAIIDGVLIIMQRYGKYIRSKSHWAYKESNPPDIRSGYSSRPDTMVGNGKNGEKV